MTKALSNFVKHSSLCLLYLSLKPHILVVSVWSQSRQPCNLYTMPSIFISRWQRQSTKYLVIWWRTRGKFEFESFLLVLVGTCFLLTAKQLKTTKSHVMVSRKFTQEMTNFFKLRANIVKISIKREEFFPREWKWVRGMESKLKSWRLK